MAKKSNTITVNDTPISVVLSSDMNNYICITDMIRAQEGGDMERTNVVIQNWMRLKDTIEFLGFWEQLSNPNFNCIEFEAIKASAGTNRFILTAKEWCSRTDAIKNTILPTISVEKKKESIIYASEADLLNIVLFGCTAKDWQEANPELAGKMNIRDTASINELLVLSNLESYNAEMIRQGKSRQERFELLMEMRNQQLKVLQQANADFNFKKLSGNDPKMIEG